MSNLYQILEKEVQCLPPKDAILAAQYLKSRDFERLRDLVDSCCIMKAEDDAKEIHKEKWQNINAEALYDLKYNLLEYMSYLDIPDEY